MKKIAVLMLVFWAGILMGCFKGYEVNKTAGAYLVGIKLDKSAPSVGKNQMTISLKDAAGKYVTDALVSVDYTMPAMPGMPAMNYTAPASLTGNGYKTTLDLSMAGSWNIVIKILRAEKTESVNFTVDAQ